MLSALVGRELFGDDTPLPPPTMCSGAITNPLVHLMGMEQYYISMYDCPDALHEVMDTATRVYEAYYDFLERKQLLLPTCGISLIAQENFAFNNELPCGKPTHITQCWGSLESQKTHSVSPDTYGEFVYPYQDRLVKRFGLLSYGCCERVEALCENHLLGCAARTPICRNHQGAHRRILAAVNTKNHQSSP